ncbi:hypothetical protein LCGC14_0599760 [marine sediment metagenome]|uniref:Uncharacterized protein n=1 Tax=marine sediment metagenome TaxID=412755 RepID=A0A0F9TX54_9ZZZZ
MSATSKLIMCIFGLGLFIWVCLAVNKWGDKMLSQPCEDSYTRALNRAAGDK